MKLWAFLLIMICGVNAIGVSGAALFSEKNQESAAVVIATHHDEQILQTVATEAGPALVADAKHSAANEHGDCGTQHQNCHTCHLGHCNFLVTSSSRFLAPDLVRAIRSSPNFSYLSIDLSGPRKPPRA